MKKIFLTLFYIFIFYCVFYNCYCTSIENNLNNDTNKYNNEVLRELRLNQEGIVPKFDENIFKYYLTVSENINEIEVIASPQNENSIIEISGNKDLKIGLNIITVKVSSEDKKQESIYTIEVTKTENIENANTNLEILAVENVLLNPPFDINTINYEVEISNEIDKINIFAIPENEEAKIEIIELEELQEGNNLIQINVTAPNGFTKKTYTINVYKRNEEENAQILENERINQEKLNGIYNAQKTSVEVEKNNRNVGSLKKNIYTVCIYFLTIIIISIVMFLSMKYYRK